jgi:hypothetical protein
MSIIEEAEALEREGSRVLVIEPDAASVTAIGLNPMDLAGRAQGRELADSVAALWSQS